MIIEGLLTTIDEDGMPHVAPLGPVVDEALTQWTLRPFQSSTTFRLLRDNPVGIFHVVDDILPVVQTALNMPHQLEFRPHPDGGAIITSACRWFRLEITDWDVTSERAEASAGMHSRGQIRDFWGWNRAKHAILEATILATRLHLLDRSQLELDLAKHEATVKKTAGSRELHAWKILQAYFANH